MRIVRRGAEAEIAETVHTGWDAIVKRRVPKAYRLRELDESIRVQRTRNEARLMVEARAHGVMTPIVYDVDVDDGVIVMEHVHGERLKDVLADDDAIDACREAGRMVALLHAGGMVHGDLTTSNMILQGDRVWLIDLSLGRRNAEVEDMGVDMHLLKRAFDSAHADRADSYEALLRSYVETFHSADAVLGKMGDIASRGRYT